MYLSIYCQFDICKSHLGISVGNLKLKKLTMGLSVGWEVSCAIPEEVVPGPMRMQAMGGKPVRRVPWWLVLPFLPAG